MKHFSNAVTESLSFCFVLLYMRTFEILGEDLIDILKQTFFQDDKKSLIALSIIKVSNTASLRE